MDNIEQDHDSQYSNDTVGQLMLRCSLIFCTVLVLCGCSYYANTSKIIIKSKDSRTPPSESIIIKKTTIEEYRLKAYALIATIEQAQNTQKILEEAKALRNIGLSILPTMIKKNPSCKEYLETVLSAEATLDDLTIEEIEYRYHSDGELPKVTLAECYHGKDLIVHPATVSILTKSGLDTPVKKRKAKVEIREVIRHINAIASSN